MRYDGGRKGYGTHPIAYPNICLGNSAASLMTKVEVSVSERELMLSHKQGGIMAF